jgi:uncharacterized membrane protein YfcA
MSPELLLELALVALCLFLGGILKGATGAGAPVLAVPALALMFDVRFAIVVMVLPNLFTNIYQAWKYRAHLTDRDFLIRFTGAGVIGAAIGTWLLVSLPLTVLPLFVAAAVMGYVVLRLTRPDWSLPLARGRALSPVAGLGAGILQGAAGLSAPISITFLNAMRLPRPVFIVTISVLFTAFTAVQLPALWLSGVAAPRELAYSLVALAPLAAGMPVGSAIARRLPPQVFDRAILALLTLIAVRLVLGMIF